MNFQEKKVDNNFNIITDQIAKAYNVGDSSYKIDKEDMVILKVRYLEVMQDLEKL